MKSIHLFGGFIQFHWFGVYGRNRVGHGYSLRDVGKKYQPLFSERHGFRVALYFIGFRFEVLKP
jgi:hypothetical protein